MGRSFNNAGILVPTEGAVRSGLTFSDFLALTKVRLSMMVVFTAVGAYVIAAGTVANWPDLIILMLGGFGVTAAANAINQAIEKDFDAVMTRTKNRPVASGRMTVSQAVMLGGFLCLLGVTALASFNVWAAFLGMLAFILYAFIYTPLKRYSSVAVFVGAIAGAMPMMIGAVAFQGGITILALTLFFIQFAWQYPHFWAIGYLGYDDYRKAGFRFVPEGANGPSRSIATSSVVYAMLLVFLGPLMHYLGLASTLASIAIGLLGSVYAYRAFCFHHKFTLPSARALMFSSLLYMPIAMIVLIIDRIS
ncbi:MAG: heme o synthase [Bacteroidota bacterium]